MKPIGGLPLKPKAYDIFTDQCKVQCQKPRDVFWKGGNKNLMCLSVLAYTGFLKGWPWNPATGKRGVCAHIYAYYMYINHYCNGRVSSPSLSPQVTRLTSREVRPVAGAAAGRSAKALGFECAQPYARGRISTWLCRSRIEVPTKKWHYIVTLYICCSSEGSGESLVLT